MDSLPKARRSENMRRIKSKNTKPEMLVRRMAHQMGYRFRLHRKDLPGKPDLVFPSRKKAIFVHGCFWHLHRGCNEGRIPSSRVAYWEPKLLRNVARDATRRRELRKLGWRSLVVWECQLTDSELLSKRIKSFLET